MFAIFNEVKLYLHKLDFIANALYFLSFSIFEIKEISKYLRIRTKRFLLANLCAFPVGCNASTSNAFAIGFKSVVEYGHASVLT